MRIGIQIFPLTGRMTGIGTYTYNLLKNLHAADNENEYFLYAPAGIKLPFAPGGRWHLRVQSSIWGVSATIWMQLAARSEFRKDKIDVFWSPGAILPCFGKSACKRVVTIHDLCFRLYPRTLRWDNRVIFSIYFNRTVALADTIVVDSLSAGNDLRSHYPLSESKMALVYAGVGREFRPYDKQESSDFISSEYGVSKKYVLSVATLEPRKNLERLLEAWLLLRSDPLVRTYQLLVLGAPGWNNKGLLRSYKEFKAKDNGVEFLDYIPDLENVARLYAGAELFILPSLYEGFGLPPLEAMASGTPVAVSDIPVFREIVAEAGFFFDPKDPNSIAGTIRHAIGRPSERERLIGSGLARARAFSWETSAQRLLELFRKTKNGT